MQAFWKTYVPLGVGYEIYLPCLISSFLWFLHMLEDVTVQCPALAAPPLLSFLLELQAKTNSFLYKLLLVLMLCHSSGKVTIATHPQTGFLFQPLYGWVVLVPMWLGGFITDFQQI